MKRQQNRTEALRKAQWYKLEAFWQDPPQRVAEVGADIDVLLRGVRYQAEICCGKCGHMIKTRGLTALTSTKHGDRLDLTPELGMCVVPGGILEEQGEALRLMLEANLRMPIVLTSDNVHLVRLRPINVVRAQEIMGVHEQGGGDDAKKGHEEEDKNEEEDKEAGEQQREGAAVRAVDSSEAP